MRKLILAGLLAGTALLPGAPASAQCLYVEEVGCLPTCPYGTYAQLDRQTGGALPDVPGPLQFECTL